MKSFTNFDESDVLDASALHNDLGVTNQEALAQAGEFFLYGEITEERAETLSTSMLRKALSVERGRRGRTSFNFHICSPGGDVNSGWIIVSTMERIKNLGIKINTRIEGQAASMGVTVAQGGTHRTATPVSAFMLHGPAMHTGWVGNSDTRENLRAMENITNSMASYLASKNTGGHNDPLWWCEKYFTNGNFWHTAQEAKDLGLIDEVAW